MVLFTLFRTFGLTVHIKAYEGNGGQSIGDATKRCRDLISTQDDMGAESEVRGVIFTINLMARHHVPDFECSHYVDDEIFQHVTWFNEWTAQGNGKEYHEVTSRVTRWIGNETEVEWDYASL